MYRLITLTWFICSCLWIGSKPGFESLLSLLASLAAFFRDEIHGVFGSNILSLNPRRALVRNLSGRKYSFVDNEFINPLILEDLCGWLSDTGDQVVAVSLTGSNKSNRYFGEVECTVSKLYPVVTAGSFSYQYLGCSYSGVHLLRTWSCSTGSGIFSSILMVTIADDSAIEYKSGSFNKVERIILKKVGMIPLGDRYEGHVRYRFGLLHVSACKGRKSIFAKNQTMIVF